MLRITLHDSPTVLRFQLEGKLVGPWVAELRRSWQTTWSVQAGRKLVIDLTDVAFIDDSGKQLLSELYELGAQFVARQPLTRAIVEQVQHGRTV
ncbi:MAG TPA: STAS domain-containing protein [Bryobacteraceae bacterium]|nr:STAS domain-containing protein [Bryobacteraceae bacterium]